MSGRNYKPFEGPLGNNRRDVEPTEQPPEVDTAALWNLREWRGTTYKQPILDDLMGHYRFNPTVNGAIAYTQLLHPRYPAGVKATGPEEARKLIDKRDAAERQPYHRAETAELATALFWSVAVVRSYAIGNSLGKISDGKPLDETAAVYAADAITDMGLCLEEPYESSWMFRHTGRKPSQGLKVQLDKIAPDIGEQVASFGAYASLDPEALRSYDGVALLEAAFEEQDYRIDTWKPRHEAITTAFPNTPVSEEILNLQVPLEEMLSIQGRLAA